MPKIQIAIVEDEESAYKILAEYLNKFAQESAYRFDIRYYPNGYSFLEEKDTAFDLVLLDIERPGMNGMELAKKIRAKDENVILIFITNRIQYAIKGYEVNALDYVLKPINYSRFQSLRKRTRHLLNRNLKDELVLKTTGGIAVIMISSINYLEISDHLLIYHTSQGDYEVWQSLSAAEDSLPKESFVRCNHSTIVNLRFVTGTEKDCVLMGGDKRISISHSKKKMFLSALNAYLGL